MKAFGREKSSTYAEFTVWNSVWNVYGREKNSELRLLYLIGLWLMGMTYHCFQCKAISIWHMKIINFPLIAWLDPFWIGIITNSNKISQRKKTIALLEIIKQLNRNMFLLNVKSKQQHFINKNRISTKWRNIGIVQREKKMRKYSVWGIYHGVRKDTESLIDSKWSWKKKVCSAVHEVLPNSTLLEES